MRWWTLVAALLVTGCYNPKIPNGTQTCSPAGTCASGYTCAVDNHCYINGQGPPATPPDLAMPPDLATPDDMAMCSMTSCAAPTPVCNSTTGLCVGCLMDSQCPDGQLCGMSNTCVAGCSLSHGCGDGGVCEVDAGVCKTCMSDHDCTDPANPRCDLSTGICVVCQPLPNDNCTNDQYCVQSGATWQCMNGCKVDDDCTPGADGGITIGSDGGASLIKLSCCNHACVDLTADSNNCGKCGGACLNGNVCCASDCTDTTKDQFNCGACNNTCGGKNANWSCTNSACAVTSCNGTFRDCNMMASDGCEANIVSDANNCLGCGKVCAVPNAMAICAQACGIGACNMGFADCNKVSNDGCEVNTTNDASNCGQCGKSCGTPNNGVAVCKNSVCGIGSCNPGFADCDGIPGNGCEANLKADPNNCNGCGMKCPTPPNGSAACVNSVCGVSGCNAPFLTCGGPACAVNGSNDVNNCNGCGNKCPAIANGIAACKSSVCGIASCNVGFADCDNNSGNGCEANTNSDLLNCGKCGNKCPAVANGVPACAAATCGIASCAAGFADCNKNPNDGCEANLNTDNANCGACGKACANGTTCNAMVCSAGITYTENFVGGQAPVQQQCDDWNNFRTSLSGNYTMLTFKGTSMPNGVVCMGASANILCQALHNNATVSAACNGITWMTGQCGGLELTSTGAICQCGSGYTVRPCIGNDNWGGVNGTTCGGPSETITIICQ